MASGCPRFHVEHVGQLHRGGVDLAGALERLSEVVAGFDEAGISGEGLLVGQRSPTKTPCSRRWARL